MGNGPALALKPHEVALLFDRIEKRSPRPAIDGLIFSFSFRGRLRVGEIATLTSDAVLDARGKIGDGIRITITKDSRTVPMHPETREALERFFRTYGDVGWFAMSPRDGRQMTPAALSMYMRRVYHELGFNGCTSYTGRASSREGSEP